MKFSFGMPQRYNSWRSGIDNNFTSHCTEPVTTYTCWGLCQSILVKWPRYIGSYRCIDTDHINTDWTKDILFCMMASSNGNLFRITAPLCGEFTGESPSQCQWLGALMFLLTCARLNGWVNNRDTGDLRRHSAHCDAIVMDMVWVAGSVIRIRAHI